MSENQEVKPEELGGKEHTSKEEASFLAKVLGWVVGRKQAGAAEPPVENLAERVKRLGPETADEAIDAAIASYRQIRQEEESKESPVKPE